MSQSVNNGIGVDIREVVNELGMSIHILERGGEPILEKIDYESNTQMTKPFTAEHFLLTTFTDTSVVIPGDLVLTARQNNKYRVMNVFDEIFEDMIIYKQCILYKCNTSVEVYSPVEKIDPRNRAVSIAWAMQHETIPALLTDKLYATRLDDEIQTVMEMDIKGLILYFPKKFEVRVKDRIVASSSPAMYEVMSIESNTFPGMNVVYLEEDNRVGLRPAVEKKPDLLP